MKHKKKFILIFLLIIISFFLSAQDEIAKVDGTFRDFYLSMTSDDCKLALEQDGYFDYRSEEVPSLLPPSDELLLDCVGRSFIYRGWFQFHQDKLVIMTFLLNPEKMDYYSLYSQLSEKYGDPDQLSPEKALWINETNGVEMELSRPLEVKYRDASFFQELIDNNRQEESMNEVLRERFLEEF